MTALRNRVNAGPSGLALASTGQSFDELILQLEQGSPAKDGTSAADLIAAVTYAALGTDESAGLPLARTKPRQPKLVPVVSADALSRLLPRAARTSVLTLSAGLLQVLDAWDASHEAAQEADDLGERDFSAYWHGIAHRREPDAGNAAYWFRRVGRHPLHAELPELARPILEQRECPDAVRRVVRGGAWDAMAMIDVCTKAKPGSPEERWARRLQRLEMEQLMDRTARAVLD
jgi:hypothetical protein